MGTRSVPKTKLGRRLKREMDARDWTYERFANELGTTKSQAHDWVNGEHEPNLSSIRLIAKVLKLDVADLIEAA